MNLARIPAQEMDAIGNTVDRGEMAPELDDSIDIDCIDAACAALAGEQREDSWAAAKVHHGIAGTHRLFNRGDIGVHSHTIREHGRELFERIEAHREGPGDGAADNNPE